MRHRLLLLVILFTQTAQARYPLTRTQTLGAIAATSSLGYLGERAYEILRKKKPHEHPSLLRKRVRRVMLMLALTTGVGTAASAYDDRRTKQTPSSTPLSPEPSPAPSSHPSPHTGGPTPLSTHRSLPPPPTHRSTTTSLPLPTPRTEPGLARSSTSAPLPTGRHHPLVPPLWQTGEAPHNPPSPLHTPPAPVPSPQPSPNTDSPPPLSTHRSSPFLASPRQLTPHSPSSSPPSTPSSTRSTTSEASSPADEIATQLEELFKSNLIWTTYADTDWEQKHPQYAINPGIMKYLERCDSILHLFDIPEGASLFGTDGKPAMHPVRDTNVETLLAPLLMAKRLGIYISDLPEPGKNYAAVLQDLVMQSLSASLAQSIAAMQETFNSAYKLHIWDRATNQTDGMYYDQKSLLETVQQHIKDLRAQIGQLDTTTWFALHTQIKDFETKIKERITPEAVAAAVEQYNKEQAERLEERKQEVEHRLMTQEDNAAFNQRSFALLNTPNKPVAERVDIMIEYLKDHRRSVDVEGSQALQQAFITSFNDELAAIPDFDGTNPLVLDQLISFITGYEEAKKTIEDQPRSHMKDDILLKLTGLEMPLRHKADTAKKYLTLIPHSGKIDVLKGRFTSPGEILSPQHGLAPTNTYIYYTNINTVLTTIDPRLNTLSRARFPQRLREIYRLPRYKFDDELAALKAGLLDPDSTEIKVLARYIKTKKLLAVHLGIDTKSNEPFDKTVEETLYEKCTQIFDQEYWTLSYEILYGQRKDKLSYQALFNEIRRKNARITIEIAGLKEQVTKLCRAAGREPVAGRDFYAGDVTKLPLSKKITYRNALSRKVEAAQKEAAQAAEHTDA